MKRNGRFAVITSALPLPGSGRESPVVNVGFAEP